MLSARPARRDVGRNTLEACAPQEIRSPRSPRIATFSHVNPGLHLHLSNRLERLADKLTALLQTPGPKGLAPETIVVQSAGMSRWLSQQISVQLGICANIHFPFPETFVSSIFRRVLGQEVSPAFAKTPLAWRIMRLLPTLIERPEFADVRAYLSGLQAERKRHQLSAQIATAFDRYLAYRPQMILGWDAGQGDDWQASLWRAITAETGRNHQPALGQQLAARLRDSKKLGSRVSVFGVSALPPFYIELLGALSARLEVHLFLLQPSPYLWTHLLSPRQEARLRRQGVDDPAALHYERGHPLLASMGDLGKYFLEAVHDLDPATVSEPFEAPETTRRLGQLQHDILEIDPADTPVDLPPDDSLQVVSCHSPTREVEILYDQLLARFAADPSLLPRDILVMTPDIEAYAPVIEAVFGTPENDQVAIPFSVADRSPRTASGVIGAFLHLLGLAGSRLPVSAVLELLEAPSVLARFDLDEADLATIREWLAATGIRWGIDAEHRRRFDMPAFSQNSWRAGLDRLLLGYALPGGGERLFAGLLPYDHIEGGGAEMLGRFVQFIEQLFTTLERLETPRTLTGWQQFFRGMAETFFASDEDTEREMIVLRRALEALTALAGHSGFDEEVSLEIMRDHLTAGLEDGHAGAGYLAGRVTFCALKPMRSIPFRVLCLLGMNDGAFPRHQATPGFDLMARHPLPGDRTTRDDDRHLFLETLLSARDALYISHVGQSARTPAPLPPSVLVSELLDYANRRFTGGLPVTRHRLQAFSPAYFEGGELFSYSQENGRASAIAQAPRGSAAPFFSQPLEMADAPAAAVDLAQLVHFFRHPVKTFLTDRLGIRLPQEETLLEDREPFAVDPLTRHHLKTNLLEHHLGSVAQEHTLALIEAQGVLPHGPRGSMTLRTFRKAALAVAEMVALHATGDPLDPETITLDIAGTSLTGTITGLTTNGLAHYRAGKCRASDLLALWIPLLALNAIRPTRGVLITEDGVRFFEPVAEPLSHLTELLDLYQRGQRQPLPLFPKSSLVFAEGLHSHAKDPLKKARAVWEGGEFSRGADSEDAHIALAFRGQENPLDDEWAAIAQAVFRPVLEASTTPG